MLEYELQKSPVNGRLWYVGGTRGAAECTAALRCRRVQKVRAAIICTTTHPPRHILQSCTRQTRKHSYFSNLKYKMFPPKQFLPQITCTAFVYASNWPADGKWRKCCFLLGMRRLSLLQLQALAFGVGRIWKCSFKLLWEDLEMQFQITLRGLSLLWLVANICFFFCWRWSKS